MQYYKFDFLTIYPSFPRNFFVFFRGKKYRRKVEMFVFFLRPGKNKRERFFFFFDIKYAIILKIVFLFIIVSRCLTRTIFSVNKRWQYDTSWLIFDSTECSLTIYQLFRVASRWFRALLDPLDSFVFDFRTLFFCRSLENDSSRFFKGKIKDRN